jgi:hypothetical protein
MDGRISVVDLEIASGAATSEALNLLRRPGANGTFSISNNRTPSRVVRVGMPAAWTAADLRIEVQAFKDDAWRLLTGPDGTVVSLVVAADQAVYLLPEHHVALYGAYAIRFLSDNGSGTPTNQGADRALSVALEGLG